MNETSPIVVEHATCLGCGCLCDDIRVTVEAGRVVEARNACESLGVPWFSSPRPGDGQPSVTIEGRPADFHQAIDRATEILSKAKSPVIRGLSASSIEAQREALAIADAIGAVVDPGPSPFSMNKLRAFQRVGQVSASLGEVKDRADLVVFWGVDPLTTHPRHLERYSVQPLGRFLDRKRTVIVVDHRPTPTALASDLCIPVAPQKQGETFWALRALIKGLAVDEARVEASTGVPFKALEDLAGRLTRARYGAFFFGPSLETAWSIEAALLMVRDLNEGRRFVAMTLGSGGNMAGWESILGWQAGGSAAIDFASGFPRYLPGDATLETRTRQGEVDAIMLVGEMDDTHLPVIRIAPGATNPGKPSLVAFDVARVGIESGGTVSRVDGVMLPLRPSIPNALPTDREVLAAIGRRLLDHHRARTS